MRNRSRGSDRIWGDGIRFGTEISKVPADLGQISVRKIYFDTNQMYFIRRIADEAQGSEYGTYEWACHVFWRNADLVCDIRALCYMVALQYEWDLDFFPSDASFAELCLRNDEKALATQEAWRVFAKGLKDGRVLRDVPFPREQPTRGCLNLSFIDDPDDRVIVNEFAQVGADVLLTSDKDILAHKRRLAELGIVVMCQSQWVNKFLDGVRGSEDAVDWLERILFGVGR
jgi:hypothetical protein